MRVFALSILLTGVALAQQPQPQPVPKFRSGVDVVLLDVTVLDANRRPIRGLKAGDFTLLEDGKPQPIVSLEELDSPEPDGALVPWMREVAPDVRTNAAEDRRIVLLVLDDANINFRHTQTVKSIGHQIVDQLGAADQVAVIFTGNNSRSQEFTGDRTLLRRAVERYADTSIPVAPGVADMAAEYIVQTIRRASESLLAIPHRRKAMILVSSLAVNAADPGSDLGFQLQQALQQAQRANVSIYPINPAGLEVTQEGAAGSNNAPARSLASAVDGGRDLAAETARTIANHTGGFAVTGSNTFGQEVQRVFRETGSYYLIGFQSPHRDGEYRRVEVTTSKPGAVVRTREGYTAAKPLTEKDKRAEPLQLIKAMSSVLPSPDVPIRVVVAPFAGKGSRADIAIALGVQQPAPQDGTPSQERMEVLSTAFDIQGRPRGSYRQTVSLKLRPTDDSGDAKYQVLSKLELEPGRYQLRFAAQSGLLSKSGSVFQDIEVPDFRKAPLSLSGVVLGVIPSLTSAPVGFLGSITPVPPTTQRIFLKGHQAGAFMRVYQGGSAPPVSVELSTSITNDRGTETVGMKETLSPEQFGALRAAEQRFSIPLDRLAPGAYLLRFTATAGKQSATRDVRFVVR